MPRTSAITNDLPLPGWVGRSPGSSKFLLRNVAAGRRGRSFRTSLGEIAVGALLVIGWAMLWAFFIAGVVEPAAGMRAVVDRPGLGVSAASPPARSRAGPGPVDTTGGAP